MKLLAKQLLKEGPGFAKMVPEEGELCLHSCCDKPCFRFDEPCLRLWQ